MTGGERTITPATNRAATMLAAMALLALLPFTVAQIPSMVDWSGHVGRYHVMLAGGRSPLLDQYYAFEWRLVGNLGVDLIVRLIGPHLGAEAAARIVAGAIAPLTILGIAAISRAAFGRIEPGAVIAACLVFGNALMFGFLNFCLAAALALLVFAAWIRLRERPAWLHMAVATPLVLSVWVAHAIGWGLLGLMVTGFEAERLWHRRRDGLPAAALAGIALRMTALVPPVLLTLAWRSDSGGSAFVYMDNLIQRKIMSWVVVLRGEGPAIDIGTIVILGGLVLLLAFRGAWRIDWRIGAGAVLVALACLVMPTSVFGSWGADERLAPFAIMLAALSLRWRWSPVAARRLVAFAGLLFAVRIGAIALSWNALDGQYRSNLQALDHVPQGARIQAMVLVNGCHAGWRTTAYPHLPDLAIVRRDAFVNAEWELPGAALLHIIYPVANPLRHDPSQMIDAFDCDGRPTRAGIDARLAEIAGGPFDYVWMLDTHGRRDLWPGHAPLYEDNSSALFALR